MRFFGLSGASISSNGNGFYEPTDTSTSSNENEFYEPTSASTSTELGFYGSAGVTTKVLVKDVEDSDEHAFVVSNSIKYYVLFNYKMQLTLMFSFLFSVHSCINFAKGWEIKQLGYI